MALLSFKPDLTFALNVEECARGSEREGICVAQKLKLELDSEHPAASTLSLSLSLLLRLLPRPAIGTGVTENDSQLKPAVRCRRAQPRVHEVGHVVRDLELAAPRERLLDARVGPQPRDVRARCPASPPRAA